MSLILEFCAFGNARDYLREHSKNFKENITFKTLSNEDSVLEDIDEPNKNSLELLVAWSYQVSPMDFTCTFQGHKILDCIDI